MVSLYHQEFYQVKEKSIDLWRASWIWFDMSLILDFFKLHMLTKNTMQYIITKWKNMPVNYEYIQWLTLVIHEQNSTEIDEK